MSLEENKKAEKLKYDGCSDIGEQLHTHIYVCNSTFPYGTCRYALHNIDKTGGFGAMTMCLSMTKVEREELLKKEECTNMRQYVGKVLGSED